MASESADRFAVMTIGRFRIGPSVVIGVAIAAALAFQLPAVARADFPLYDGGMLSLMASELAGNGFALPRFTSYNGGDIPFAYPPLGLYVTAGLHKLTGWSLPTIVQWLPLVISLLTVVAFVALARRLLPSSRAAALAAVAFPLLPYSYQWVIMGHGVTRALGFLFAVLAATAAADAAARPRPAAIALAALATAGAVLSHPELGVFALLGVVLIPFLLGRGRVRWLLPAAIVPGALLLSAPWWATILARFGAAPFRAASSSAPFSLRGFLTAVVVFPLSAEPYLRVLGVVGLLGVFLLATTSRPLAPAWLVLTIAAIPRNAPTPMTVPLALAIGAALDEIVISAASLAGARTGRRLAPSLAPAALIAWVLGYAALENYLLLQRADVLLPVLSRGEREIAEWAGAHTPPGSAFILVTTTDVGQRDPLPEWFPALSGRTSLVTPQGGEWTGHMVERSALDARIKGCQTAGLDCIARVAAEGVPFTYVLVGREPRGSVGVDRLRAELAISPGFRCLFDGAGGSVFERTPPR